MDFFLESGMHWRILNFVIFVGVLFFILRKPLREFWGSRAHRTQFEIEEATKLRRQEEEKYRVLARRVGNLEKEIEDLLKALKDEGEIEKERIISEAERYAVKLKSDSSRIAEQEIRKAKTLLKQEAVRLSVEMAERLIRAQMRPEDQKTLAEGAVARWGAP